MCGIFGFVGKRPADEVILDGLRRLEYRGYDSAGIAVVRQGRLHVRRASGKLAALAARLSEEPLGGEYGVGHTRWATHGRPTEENAHPHVDCTGRIVVVHNGIIENYAALKRELVAAGHRFTTQTDTEVVAHFAEANWDGDLAHTLAAIAPRLEGSFAVVLLAVDAPERLVALRRGPSLVVGLGEGETYISSDLPGLVSLTRDVVFVEDGEVAEIRRDGVRLWGADGRPVERPPQRVGWDAIRVEKEGRKHFMLKEIHEQPTAIRETLVGRFDAEQAQTWLAETGLDRERMAAVERVALVACGTAHYASLVGRAWMEALARIPVEAEVASEFRYRDPLVGPGTLAVAVSQSGETADTLAAMREARARGARVLAVCNVQGSLATREADGTLLTHAGPEIGVASTKAFTAQLAALALLAVDLALARGRLAREAARELLAALAAIPHLVERALALENEVECLARRFTRTGNFLYIGRGVSYPIALEGALKLKEISYVHAEGYAGGEMKHGPIALIDEGLPVVAVVPRDGVRDKTLANLEEARARGAFLIAVGEEGDEELVAVAGSFLGVPRTHPLLSPFLTVVPLQLLAYHIAEKRGCDIDQPRNLAKSVTVE